MSSIIYKKAKELLASGAIGTLNIVTAWWDRNSAQGAWQYTVPYDTSPTTCDWPRWLGTAPKIPFNAEHFFQWRKWKAYGSRGHSEANEAFVSPFEIVFAAGPLPARGKNYQKSADHGYPVGTPRN